MKHGKQRRPLNLIAVAALAAAGLAVLAGCGGSSEPEAGSSPAKVEEVDGSGLKRVVLTEKAAERLDIQTAPVRNGSGETVIPYAAVLYDTNGETWTYTSPEPLVFVRNDIRVDRIEGGRAFLSDGPPAGTPVVTVGATELWGVEYGGIEED